MIRQYSAGGVVYKKQGNEVLYLLRQDSLSNQWTLPKGWLDDAPDGISPGLLTLGKSRATEDQIRSSALREVAEEGGVEAKIISRLASVQYYFVDHLKQKVMKTVIYYLMAYQKDIESGYSSETSAVKWVPQIEAGEILKKRKNEAALISQAGNIL